MHGIENIFSHCGINHLAGSRVFSLNFSCYCAAGIGLVKAVLSAVEHDLSAVESILDDMAASEWDRTGRSAAESPGSSAPREPSLAPIPDIAARNQPAQSPMQRQAGSEYGSCEGSESRKDADGFRGQRERRERGRDRRQTSEAPRPQGSEGEYLKGCFTDLQCTLVPSPCYSVRKIRLPTKITHLYYC